MAALLMALVMVACSVGPAQAGEPEGASELRDAQALLQDAWERLNQWQAAEWQSRVLAWEDYRRMMALVHVVGGPVGENDARLDEAARMPAYRQMLAQLTRDHAQLLRALGREHEGSAWSGVWRDGRGGELHLLEHEGWLHWRIDVVRGPTSHVGQMAARTPIRESLACYHDAADQPEKVREFGQTVVIFIQRARRHIEVVAANTQWYHGARAYFHGHYIRVGPLAAEDAARLLEDELEGIEWVQAEPDRGRHRDHAP